MHLKPRVQGLEGRSEASLCISSGDEESRTLIYAGLREWFRDRAKVQQLGIRFTRVFTGMAWSSVSCLLEQQKRFNNI